MLTRGLSAATLLWKTLAAAILSMIGLCGSLRHLRCSEISDATGELTVTQRDQSAYQKDLEQGVAETRRHD